MKKEQLRLLYVVKKQPVSEIAKHFKCSQNKVNYWLAKYRISKRTISEAIYQLRNPRGDPFRLKFPSNVKEGILFGLGLGLYWGEGLKRGKGAVRLGNTDVGLIRKFLEFLEKFCNVKKDKLKFGLQVFGDISPEKARRFWMCELGINRSQFYKVMISRVRGTGTYKYKSENGVLMVYFNNIKLKRVICGMIDNL